MSARSPEAAIASRENLFDLLRVAAALTVIFSHSFSFTGHSEPVRSATGLELGTLGVFTLFGMSGYLLAAGWAGPQTGREFWVKRGLRLMPGLIVSAALTALVLGPLVSDLGAGAYLSRPATYAYVARHALLDTFDSRLPGVFTHNPFPDVVNGSLWTIPVEVCCYGALFVGVKIGALRHPRLLLGLLALVCAAIVIGHPPDNPMAIVTPTGDELLGSLRACAAFLTGVLLWELRAHVPRRLPLAVLALAVVAVPLPSGLHSAVAMTMVPYVAVVVGSLRPGRLAVLTSEGDVTYGMYVYAAPLQQTLVGAIAGITPIELLALSAPLCWLCGLISWRLVERPAMSLRRRLAPAVTAVVTAP